MLYIESEPKFGQMIIDLKDHELIGLDTEFVRRDTYFAKLSLIQISTKNQIYVVDPLVVNVSKISEILLNRNITKIFHAPHQDLGIFYHDFGVITENIFDIQSAVKFLGIRNQISYQDACEKILNINIEKTQQFREWNLRPLSKEMIEYAAQDVLHLIPLFEKLKAKMEEKIIYKNFCHFMNEQFCKKEFYQLDFEDIWKKVKTNERNRSVVDNIKHLASYREECAIELDIPRLHVLSDEGLSLIAKKLPVNDRELNSLNLKLAMNNKQKQKLYEICNGMREVL
jgi:ribonuclease D